MIDFCVDSIIFRKNYPSHSATIKIRQPLCYIWRDGMCYPLRCQRPGEDVAELLLLSVGHESYLPIPRCYLACRRAATRNERWFQLSGGENPMRYAPPGIFHRAHPSILYTSDPDEPLPQTTVRVKFTSSIH